MPAMAARSPDPAKRRARPQAFSASAAGRRCASISARTSIAAERRAPGVMSRGECPSCARVSHAARIVRAFPRDGHIVHMAFDAFGDQLERVLDVLLEISVGGAARHGADRAHAAIGLVGSTLIEKHLT